MQPIRRDFRDACFWMKDLDNFSEVLAQRRLTSGDVQIVEAARQLLQRLEGDFFLGVRGILPDVTHLALRIAAKRRNDGKVHVTIQFPLRSGHRTTSAAQYYRLPTTSRRSTMRRETDRTHCSVKLLGEMASQSSIAKKYPRPRRSEVDDRQVALHFGDHPKAPTTEARFALSKKKSTWRS